MTLAAEPPATDRARRRISRIERQARVGILRNTNEPPRPPTRRASLTGRWLSLRSSRRPAPPADPVAEVAPPPRTEEAIRHDPDGRLAAIDVAGLMASVDGIGTTRPIRTPYGARIRPDTPTSDSVPVRRRPSILRAESWRELNPVPEPDAVPAPVTVATPRQRRADGGFMGTVLGGLAVALVLLVLIPAAFGL